MNRLVLIGNGFDLAHGLKTSYADFINWYWETRVMGFNGNLSTISQDCLCSFEDLRGEVWNVNAFSGLSILPGYNVHHFTSAAEVIEQILLHPKEIKTTFSPFFVRIIKSIESKGWVDIENEYYNLLTDYAFPLGVFNEGSKEQEIKALNEQLHYLQELLIEYLKEITKEQPERVQSISNAIYAPFKENDFSIDGTKKLEEHKSYWEFHEERDNELIYNVKRYGLDPIQCEGDVRCWREDQPNDSTIYPPEFLLPKEIMALNFNYTHTAQIYSNRYDSFEEVHIHGDFDDKDSIIFGYGDELHTDFVKLKEHDNNECLQNVKSIRYQEAPNYKHVLRFIESEPFQVLIMGHSCGNSDRTLLNTIFEHKNCVSIKPYYYKKEDGTDNYIEIVQNISRNFTDMKLMRDRVVNKTQCEPLVHQITYK